MDLIAAFVKDNGYSDYGQLDNEADGGYSWPTRGLIGWRWMMRLDEGR